MKERLRGKKAEKSLSPVCLRAVLQDVDFEGCWVSAWESQQNARNWLFLHCPESREGHGIILRSLHNDVWACRSHFLPSPNDARGSPRPGT